MDTNQTHDDAPVPHAPEDPIDGTTRREFLTHATAIGAGASLTPLLSEDAEAAGIAPAPPRSQTVRVKLKVNDKARSLKLDPRVTLLDALREQMQLTGTKKGCDHGQCGACTVHVNGERVLSCLTLAASCADMEVVTVEGLAKGDELHPVQTAFVEHDAFQCGYCTPGQIMAAVALLREGRAGSDAEIREGMSGNLCRCGAYPHILTAIKAARDSGQKI